MLTPKSEYDENFLDYMKNRMGVSYYKYGPLKKAYPHKVNAIKSLETRIKLYKETGNTEYLVDIANFAMIEFMLPAHENAHFNPTDENGSPGRNWYAGGPPNKRTNE